MSSETIVEGIFLIATVLAVSVLVVNVLPAALSISAGMASSRDAEIMRTDFKIVCNYANDTAIKVWMKNIGSRNVPLSELEESSAFAGNPEGFGIVPFEIVLIENRIWRPGETICVLTPNRATSEKIYFAFVLPNGVKREKLFKKFEPF